MWYGTYVSAALRSGQFDPVHFGTVVDIDHGWLVGVSERLNVTDGTPARPPDARALDLDRLAI